MCVQVQRPPWLARGSGECAFRRKMPPAPAVASDGQWRMCVQAQNAARARRGQRWAVVNVCSGTKCRLRLPWPAMGGGACGFRNKMPPAPAVAGGTAMSVSGALLRSSGMRLEVLSSMIAPPVGYAGGAAVFCKAHMDVKPVRMQFARPEGRHCTFAAISRANSHVSEAVLHNRSCVGCARRRAHDLHLSLA